MSDWSVLDGDEPASGPFSVVLSLGTPRPFEQLVDDRPDDPDRPTGRDAGEHWLWQESLLTLLHVVFRRGGAVVTRFDEDTFPILWAVARQYATPDPAEHGVRRPDAPLVVYAPSGWYDRADDDVDGERRDVDSVEAFEATGAVRVHRELDAAFGDGRRLGIELWADDDGVISDDRDTQLLERAPTREVISRAELRDGGPALQSMFEHLVDRWLDEGGR